MTERLKLENLPKVRGDYKFSEPLAKYNWLGVGGAAEVMFFPADIADLQEFMQKKNPQIPVFILGGGANLLIRDGGIKGVIIKLANKSFTEYKIEDNLLICGGGCLNFSLQKIIAQEGLHGLEFLCSIPGTVGGAMRSNAGCFGSDISQVLQYAKIINENGDIFTVKNEDFNFGYRHSDFPTDWIILEAGFKFAKGNLEEVKTIIEQNSTYRKTHQPQGIRTAGSTFKNPKDNAAWKLIKAANADKFEVGKVKMSPQHCNFLQNEGNSANDIEKLCHKIINAVKTECGVELELEINVVGQE